MLRRNPRISPLTGAGQPQTGAADTDGAAFRVAERRKHAVDPELCQRGPQELVVLGKAAGIPKPNACSESGRKEPRRPCTRRRVLHTAARAGWTSRRWGMRSVAVQQAAASTTLGPAWPAPLHPPARRSSTRARARTRSPGRLAIVRVRHSRSARAHAAIGL